MWKAQNTSHIYTATTTAATGQSRSQTRTGKLQLPMVEKTKAGHLVVRSVYQLDFLSPTSTQSRLHLPRCLARMFEEVRCRQETALRDHRNSVLFFVQAALFFAGVEVYFNGRG